jgi:hypothetical protein
MSDRNDPEQHDPDVPALIEEIRKQFQPGGALAPIEDLAEYERQMNALPPEERDLAKEVTTYANLGRFFSDKRWVIPYHIRQAVLEVRSMEIPDRIARMREVNEALMECIDSACEDSEFRM